MAPKIFQLIATVSTDNPPAVQTALKELIGARGTVESYVGNERAPGDIGKFSIRAELQGESAKELNRELLSALRKVEKKTRLRSAWSCGGEVEQYFDYVLKKTTRKQVTDADLPTARGTLSTSNRRSSLVTARNTFLT